MRMTMRSAVGHMLKIASGAVFLAMVGCAIIGGFNARSHEHLTSLKATHMKFIDDFTAGGDKVFSAEKLESERDRMDLKFREALEFSRSLSDRHRTLNYEHLRSVFQEDFENIKGKGRFLSAVEAETLAEPTAMAYDRAIQGECVRPGGSCR